MRKMISLLTVVSIIFSMIAFSACTSEKKITLYVSEKGSDENSGTIDSPFATLDRAIEELNELSKSENKSPVEVLIREGNYTLTESLSLTTYPFGVTMKAYEKENVSLTGGVKIYSSDFSEIKDDLVLSRLSEEQKAKIKVVNLKEKGLTAEQIGNIHAVGGDTSEGYYDYVTPGTNTDIYKDGERLINARYPNSGEYCYITDVLDRGDSNETIEESYKNTGKAISNPRGGTIKLTHEVMEHVKTWEDNKIWAYGYFMYDWADGSTPIKTFDFENDTLTFEFYSSHGYAVNGYLYFFNVLEELDTPEEYYIDRENLLMYCFFDENKESEFVFPILEDTIIKGNTSDFTFENIKFDFTKNDCINLSGNNITIRNCTISRCSGTGISIKGNNNLVYGCELSHLGKAGVILEGGELKTLTAGNNIIENCDIHDFAQVYRTYQPGAYVLGAGGKIIHNEIYNAPHEAVSFTGAEHIIAYNYIHDVALEVNDGGAIYSGRNWAAYGNLIENNIIENIGLFGESTPSAIYLDDGISGITVRNNIIKTCTGYALNICSGHDLIIENNIIIKSAFGIDYDSRTMKGKRLDFAIGDKSSRDLINSIEEYLENEIWLEKYPVIGTLTFDRDRSDEPEYIGNPSRSSVKYNFFLGCSNKENYDEEILEYVEIGPNYSCALSNLSENGYTVSGKGIFMSNADDFQNPDISIIGRYKENIDIITE